MRGLPGVRVEDERGALLLEQEPRPATQLCRQGWQRFQLAFRHQNGSVCPAFKLDIQDQYQHTSSDQTAEHQVSRFQACHNGVGGGGGRNVAVPSSQTISLGKSSHSESVQRSRLSAENA